MIQWWWVWCKGLQPWFTPLWGNNEVDLWFLWSDLWLWTVYVIWWWNWGDLKQKTWVSTRICALEQYFCTTKPWMHVFRDAICSDGHNMWPDGEFKAKQIHQIQVWWICWGLPGREHGNRKTTCTCVGSGPLDIPSLPWQHILKNATNWTFKSLSPLFRTSMFTLRQRRPAGISFPPMTTND